MSTAQSRVDKITKQVDPAKGEVVSITANVNGVAVITFDNPPVNSFSPAVATALSACLDVVEKDASVKAVVLTGKGKCFVAGADIPHLNTMVHSGTPESIGQFIAEAHKLADRIEAFPKTVVAALNGDALGGGCEIAVASHYRVALAKAKLGLPELKLGVIPGMGGTQRYVRLVGFKNGLESILGSKNLTGDKAQKAGLVDVVSKTPKALLEDAVKLALSAKPRKTSEIKFKETEEEIRAVALGARVQSRKKAPLPHVLGTIDVVELGALQGAAAGLKAEQALFVKAMGLPFSKALIHMFLASKAAGRSWPGVSKAAAAAAMAKTKAPKRVAIIGGGTMGAGIAVCFIAIGVPTIIKEISDDACAGAVERVLNFVEGFVKARKLGPFAVEHIMRNLTVQQSYAGFDKVDIAIEAAVERVDLKKKILKELVEVCSPTCIISTNTSTIDIDVCGSDCGAAAQSRIVGLHFFSPAPIMPLVEVISGSQTSAETLAVCMHAAKKISKTPVVVRSCVGFLANRVFVPYSMSAMTLIQAGACPYALDKTLQAFGMPMGPCSMSDSVGLDIPLHLRPIFETGYPGRIYSPTIIDDLFKTGRAGIKSGKGFYVYPNPTQPSKRQPDWNGIKDVIAKSRAEAAALKLPDASKFTPEDIALACMLPVVNECARVWKEQVVATEADMDIASIFGYGFPAYRGGVWHWALNRPANLNVHYGPQDKNSVFAVKGKKGLALCVEQLQKISDIMGQGKSEIREFYKPSAALIELAAKQQ